MKALIYILFTSLLCCLVNICFSQQASTPRDVFGNSSTLFAYNSNLPLRPASLLSVYIYDSIRPLSELTSPVQGEAYPWISPDGLRLYYTNGADSNKLYFTSRPDIYSYFNAPVLVPIGVQISNSSWLSADELDVYCSNGNDVYYIHRNSIGAPFSLPLLLNLNVSSNAFWGISLDSAQNTMYIGIFGGPYAGINEFTRTSPTDFAHVRKMAVPSPSVFPQLGQLSKNDLTYFLTAFDGVNNKIFSMDRATVLDTFDVATFSEVQNINDSSIILNGMASVSDGMNWMVIVRNNNNLWEGNDMYIASKAGVLTSVFEPGSSETIRVFPNPAVSEFYISGAGQGTYEILDITGKQINTGYLTSDQEKTKINTSDFSNGLYVLIIRSEERNTVEKLIISQH